MNTGIFANLDQAELLQLALNASAGGDAGNAIAYLKEAVSRADGTALAHYLLGAEYAQIRMYDRAIGEMEAAVALDPALAIARLQLGMLWLGAGDNGRAALVLSALEELNPNDPLHQFGAGLLRLIRGERSEAKHCLQQGMALNTRNPALNGDMQKVVLEIEQQLAANPEQPQDDGGQQCQQGQHILLSAYTSNDNH